ncbi:DUF4129 domain-containing protein [Zhouia spongiae]|uniref:DUF4129 domain-containing protein n=1 Tax=Zhouia spongiae TaxID=2202721 RepID=A0ABY3YLN0_9FLAO|nr:DUF4129 domain-containing protein [Zhouia spongiae]UNY98704.1 DUF4129 domain-containing protein [Zhouia spongiae]
MKNTVFFLLFFAHSLLCCCLYAQSGLPAQKDSLQLDREPVKSRSFGSDFKEKYSGDAYNYQESVAGKGWFTRFKEWLAERLSNLFDFDTPADAQSVADTIFKVFYVLIIIAVIFIIVKLIMNREGRWVFGKSGNKNILKVEDIENHIHITDFNSLILNAVNNTDYRLAVRYYYLWLLKELTNKDLIAYDAEKTNSDYLNEINNQELKDNFSYASYLYNYIWYGEFKVGKDDFDKVSGNFVQLINSIRK